MEHEIAAHAAEALRSAGLIPTLLAAGVLVAVLLLIQRQFDA